MNSSKEMLTSLLRTTQMGQVGIRSVLESTMRPALRKALESQLREYDSIETEAHTIASQRGWELPELEPAVRFMADMMTRARLSYNCNDSKIAGMMVQGNTRGVIKGLKNSHRYHHRDSQIDQLSQKLLDCENNNIVQMERFL